MTQPVQRTDLAVKDPADIAVDVMMVTVTIHSYTYGVDEQA